MHRVKASAGVTSDFGILAFGIDAEQLPVLVGAMVSR